MEVPGNCQLCQTEASLRTCKLCGLLVCKSHYIEEVGACTKCVPTHRGHSREDEPVNLPPLPEDAGKRLT